MLFLYSSYDITPILFSAILQNKIGHSLTIGVRSAPVMHRLQIIPLATVNKTTDGKTYGIIFVISILVYLNMNCIQFYLSTFDLT